MFILIQKFRFLHYLRPPPLLLLLPPPPLDELPPPELLLPELLLPLLPLELLPPLEYDEPLLEPLLLYVEPLLLLLLDDDVPLFEDELLPCWYEDDWTGRVCVLVPVEVEPDGLDTGVPVPDVVPAGRDVPGCVVVAGCRVPVFPWLDCPTWRVVVDWLLWTVPVVCPVRVPLLTLE